MKKLSLALACIIGMMFFASCNPDAIDDLLKQKPTVEFVSGDDLVSDFSGFWVGTELHFQIMVAPNATSQSAIQSVHFAIHDLNGNAAYTDDPEITNPNGETVIDETFVSQVPSTYTVSALVKDAAGRENTVVFTVDYVEPIQAVIGKFGGNVVIKGHVKADQTLGTYSLDDDFETEELYSEVVLGTIEGDRVLATFEIDGRPVSLHCTQNDNTFTFDEFHFNRAIPVSNLGVRLDITVNATATLEDGVFTLAGTSTGIGAITGISLLNATATLSNGTIDGVFNQITE